MDATAPTPAPADPAEAMSGDRRGHIQRIAGSNEERSRFEDTLCARLCDAGRLDPAGAARASRARSATREPVATLLVKLGLASEGDVAEALAAVLGLTRARTDETPHEAVLDGRLSLKFLRESRVLPLAEGDGDIRLAMVDPLDVYSVSAVEYVLERPVVPCVAVPSELETALERLAGGGTNPIGQIVEDIAVAETDGDGMDDMERLKDLASEAPVIRLVNLLIGRALEARASDIHLESFENEMRVRYRIDGVLRTVELPPVRLRAAIVSRIKIMARLNIAERRLPQDGRIKLSVKGRDIDLRVATSPGLHGESVVLRILDRGGVALDFQALGFDDALLGPFTAALDRPNGILLITGPTGSGKTTTLYTSLLRLNTPERKIITVEDPIEYQIQGVNQIQVKPQIGLSFAAILRSVLRHDPDVIMVGEIRDQETALIAVQAALTGHLVVSTLHTNSAAAAIGRLLDMGVDDYLLASTVVGVLAQRLVRTLCPACKTPHRTLPELARHLEIERFADGQPIRLHHPVGCDLCNGTGYRGRLAVMEFLTISDEVARLVLDRADVRRIQDLAVGSGMRTLYEDGLRKALAGSTSLEEVLRVAREA